MEKNFYKVVADEKLVKNFLEDIGVNKYLNPEESFLVQTAFRTKRLSEKEKELLGNRHKDSFMTKVLKVSSKTGAFDFESALNKLYELEIPVRACTYNVGTPEEVSFPQSAFVTYIMPNPSNEIKVASEHVKKVNELFTEALMCNEKAQEGFRKQIAKTNNDFRAERATCIDAKWNSSFVNFDIDLQLTTGYIAWKKAGEKIQEIIKEAFDREGTEDFKILLVICNGGFHILVPKAKIKKDPKEYIEKIRGPFPYSIKEIEYKGTKSYTPLPGTYQYGDDENHIVQYVKF